MTGVGGGIFLAPLVLSLGWATMRQTAATSVVFNLVNSVSALAGAWATLPLLPARLPIWLVCVGLGGLLGSWVGACTSTLEHRGCCWLSSYSPRPAKMITASL